jgi:hypothetical protein
MAPTSNIYVVHADMTQLGASALGFSTSSRFDGGGQMYAGFARSIDGFADGYQQLAQKHQGAAVGSGFWLPVRDADPVEGVVAVVTVGDGLPVCESTARSVEGALRCAALHVAPRDGHRPLIALPAFHAGHGGGHRQLLEVAEAQIATAVRVARERHLEHYDIAFCPYTRTLHHIYLRARERVIGSPRAFSPPPAKLVSAIRRRECAFFIGSGMSAGANLPSWKTLIGRLAADLGLQPPDNPDLEYFLDLAQWHRESSAGERLEDIVAELFDTRALGRRPTLAHYLMLALPVRQVITTNYDGLIEQTFEALRRRYFKVVHQAEVAETGRTDGTAVVKLHGDAQSPDHIVLSRDDYDGFFTRRPAMAALLEGLLLNHTFLFIGYSLRDLNFRQIYNRIAVMLEDAKRPAYAVTFDDDNPHLTQQWRNKGLELIQVPGKSILDKQLALLCWLDHLAEETIGGPRVFLAPDAFGGALAPMRDELRALGNRVVDACREPLQPEDARVVADLLVFLIDLGWRPSNNRPLSHLLMQIAERVGDSEHRDRLLALALERASKLKDVLSIKRKLDS